MVVLDDAQRVHNIGLNLKILHDHRLELQMIATGSSNYDLSNQINEPLTGRVFDYMLFPLSVEELLSRHDTAELFAMLPNLLRFGLYPEVLGQDEENAKKLLDTITSNYLYRDILELEKIKKSDRLINILQLLAFHVGSEVSYSEIGAQLGLNTVTVQHYIDLLEKSFVIFRLRGFSRNSRKEVTKSVKIYFWDLGIRNSLIRNFNPLDLRNDAGALWENFFIAERLKYLNNHQHFINAYFWRTYEQKEIDYLEESECGLRAFECKWNVKKKTKPPKIFLETYQNSTFQTVTPDNFDELLS